MMGKRQIVGLAAEERRILAAETVRAGGEPTSVQSGQFAFPDGVSWDEPRALGERLGAWLREQGYGRSAVIGLPARWLLTAGKGVPPADREALRGVLRLAAERAFSIPAGELVCDYASAPPEGEGGTALLVAARRDRVEACAEVARAAGLKLRAVTSTIGAMALAGEAPDGVTVLVGPADVEAALVRGGRLRAVRHVPLGATSAATEAAELVLQSALGAGGGPVEHVRRHDDAAQMVDAVAGRLGLNVRPGPAPAAALALGYLDGRALPFDLAASRLAERTRRPWRRWAAWAALLLAVAVVAVVAFALDRARRRAEIAELRARLREMAPSAVAAGEVVETVSLARGWYDRRPPLLDCLRALTLAFPEEGRVWATSLALTEEMRGVLSGRAADERSVLGVLDAMKGSGEFAEVKLLYIRESRGAEGGTAFAAAFTYAPEGQEP